MGVLLIYALVAHGGASGRKVELSWPVRRHAGRTEHSRRSCYKAICRANFDGAQDVLEWHVVGTRPDTPSPATVRRVGNVRPATAV